MRATLHAPRALALSELRAAAASGDYDDLHDALYSAQEAGLEGDFATDGIGPGGRWMTREVTLTLTRTLTLTLTLTLALTLTPNPNPNSNFNPNPHPNPNPNPNL